MSSPFTGFPSVVERLLTSSWQAGLLVLLVLAAQRLFRRHLTPRWRHALWWVVLGRLLIATPPPAAWSVFNFLPAPAISRSPRPNPSGDEPGWQLLHADMRVVPRPVIAPEVPPEPDDGRLPGARAAGGPTRVSPVHVFGATWAVVSAVLLLRLALRSRWFGQRVRDGMRPAGIDLRAQLDATRARMGVRRRVELLVGDLVVTPAVYGILRPRILLPARLVDSSPAARLEHIFLHELAHVRRNDLAVHGLIRVLRALHWFNPVLAWAFRRMQADREEAADALALDVAGERERRAYGLTLVQLLEDFSGRSTQPGTLGIVEENASLERRIRAIADYHPAPRRAAAAALLVIGLAAVSWTGATAPRSGLGTGASITAVAPLTPVGLVPSVAAQAPAPASSIRSDPAVPPKNQPIPGLPSSSPAARSTDPARVEHLVAEARRLIGEGDKPLARVLVERLLVLAPDEPRVRELERQIRETGGVTDGSREPRTTDPGRERNLALLESTRIPEIGFVDAPLELVLRSLKDIAAAHDPARRGLNFFLLPSSRPLLNPSGLGTGVPVIDPATGQPVPDPVAGPVPIGSVRIRLDPPLRDARLIDVLRAITRGAETPIRFVLEDYAVVFSHQEDGQPLATRFFRVDAQRFGKSLEKLQRWRNTNAPGTGEPSSLRASTGSEESKDATESRLQERLRGVLEAIGISLGPPSAVFFNDRLGQLMVRAGPEEIETIDLLLEALHVAPADSEAAVRASASRDTEHTVERLNEFARAIIRLADAMSLYPPESREVADARSRARALERELVEGLAPEPASPPNVPAAHTLVLAAEGGWILDGRLVGPADRAAMFQGLSPRSGSEASTLNIRSDVRVPWKDLVEAMELARKAGITRVTAATLP